MDPVTTLLSTFTTVALVSRLGLDVADLVARKVVRGIGLVNLYGAAGIALLIFGSRTTWRLEAQVIGRLEDEDATNFKKSVYDECTMISVAAAIVAQIAITGLSLGSLSQTHWIARAALVSSVTFALMAVYYATTQQRTLGRLLQPRDVRAWIRGGNQQSEAARIVPSLEDLYLKFLEGFPRKTRSSSTLSAFFIIVVGGGVQGTTFSVFDFLIRWIFGISKRNRRSSAPSNYTPDLSSRNIKADIVRDCFAPSPASIITISAPQMLLSGSLVMLLVALGIYLGFTWTRSLDADAGINDSKNVFIIYIFSLSITWLVYSICLLFQDDEKRSERQILEGYLRKYIDECPDVVAVQWGVDVHFKEENLSFKFKTLAEGSDQNNGDNVARNSTDSSAV